VSGWKNSDRRDRLPANWGSIRKKVLERDGYRCTWAENGKRCPERATDVDHRRPKTDDHRESELRSLCCRHHSLKSAREGHAIRQKALNESRSKFRRGGETHPGLLG
jgi:hypothetical protein